MQKKQLGKLGEKLAAEYLQSRGYRILKKNFSCRQGEIDLVAFEGQDLVFVEVKTRWGKDFGLPEEAVTRDKVQHIKKAGFFYHSLYPQSPESLRIDVVSITFLSGEQPEIRLFKNIEG